MKTQVRIPADQLEVGDRIIKTFGTNGRSSFEVESIEQDQGWLRVDGYKSVRAGVCGPASATYKHSELVDVERVWKRCAQCGGEIVEVSHWSTPAPGRYVHGGCLSDWFSEAGAVSVETLTVAALLAPTLLAVVVFTARMFGALAGVA